MNVLVVGTGYVGLVTGLCFAKLGHNVICVDKDVHKINALRNGKVPIYEPGLQDLLVEQLGARSISFVEVVPESTKADVAVIAVGTPALPSGEADLSAVYAVVTELACTLPAQALVAIKSTVPVGTAQRIKDRMVRVGRSDLHVASVPEFLREGSAVYDVFHPYRLVFGVMDSRSVAVLRTLHAGLDAPVVVTDPASAEMIKYASNAFLATKISFINEIANICGCVGADVTQVAYGMGLDPRIGPAFLRAGLGYGGSCFPKDTRALVNLAGENGYDFQLLRAVVEVNQRQRLAPIIRLREEFGSLRDKVVTLLGVAFKPGTDDVRESPAIDLCKALHTEGARVRLCDPVVTNVDQYLPDAPVVIKDPYKALDGADAAVLVTEWPEFLRLDWARAATLMRHPYVFDGRNVFEPSQMRSKGLLLANIGGRGHDAIPHVMV